MLCAGRADGNGECFAHAAARTAFCLLFRHLGDAGTLRVTPDCLGIAVVLGTHCLAHVALAVGPPSLRLTLARFVTSCCLRHAGNSNRDTNSRRVKDYMIRNDPLRVVYPTPRITKLDVVRYYEAVAARMPTS
jgi:hypothetical protein